MIFKGETTERGVRRARPGACKTFVIQVATLLFIVSHVATFAITEEAYVPDSDVQPTQQMAQEAPEPEDTAVFEEEPEETEYVPITEPPSPPIEVPENESPPTWEAEVTPPQVGERPDAEDLPEETVEPEPEEMRDVWITYLDAAGNVAEITSLAYGELIHAPQVVPAWPGYQFLHWYDVEDVAHMPFVFDIAATGDRTIAPLFTPLEGGIELPIPPAENAEDAETEETQHGGESFEDAASAVEDAWLLPVYPADEQTDDQSDNEADAQEQTPPQEQTPQDVMALIGMDVGDTVAVGQSVRIQAMLQGLDDTPHALQWEYSDGDGWQDQAGETGDSLHIMLDETTYNRVYRIRVQYGEQTVHSNAQSVSQLAQLAEEPDESSGEETHATYMGIINILWTQGDADEADHVTVIAKGQNSRTEIDISRENGWQGTFSLPSHLGPFAFSLADERPCAVTMDGDAITITIAANAKEDADETDADEEEPGMTDIDALQRSISVETRAHMTGDTLWFGDTVTFTGVLTGFDGDAFSLCWQVDHRDGHGFQDIEGAHDIALSIVLDEYNARSLFRLRVSLLTPIQEVS